MLNTYLTVVWWVIIVAYALVGGLALLEQPVHWKWSLYGFSAALLTLSVWLLGRPVE